MKIHDFVSAMNGGDDHEFRIYTDAEQPVLKASAARSLKIVRMRKSTALK